MGTHALLQSGISFANLGLLVIDEEQVCVYSVCIECVYIYRVYIVNIPVMYDICIHSIVYLYIQ